MPNETLESTTPAQGATLDVAPRQVTLRFSEPVEIALGAVDVHDSSAARVRSGAPFHPAGETRAVAVRLPAQLPFGVYTTTYRVVSADSHPVSGGFVFAIGRGRAAPALTVDELRAGGGVGRRPGAVGGQLQGNAGRSRRKRLRSQREFGQRSRRPAE